MCAPGCTRSCLKCIAVRAGAPAQAPAAALAAAPAPAVVAANIAPGECLRSGRTVTRSGSMVATAWCNAWARSGIQCASSCGHRGRALAGSQGCPAAAERDCPAAASRAACCADACSRSASPSVCSRQARRAGPAPAGSPALDSGANVTLQLNGVTPQQFLGHQAQYNHIIAEARPAAREPLHAGCEPAGLACLPVVVLHGPSDSTVRVSTDGVAEKTPGTQARQRACEVCESALVYQSIEPLGGQGSLVPFSPHIYNHMSRLEWHVLTVLRESRAPRRARAWRTRT